jgi:hypothetical protein
MIMKSMRFTATTLSLLLGLASDGTAHSARVSQPASSVQWTAVTHSILAVKYMTGKDTSIDVIGTPLDPHAHGKAEIKFTRGRADVKLEMADLGHPQSLGAFYTTYVLWAFAPEGQATNIAELPIKDEFSIHVSSPFQTFGLIVTAEPHAAVKLPSPVIVAENALRKSTEREIETSRIAYRGDPGTFFVTSANAPAVAADFRTPLPVLGARRAVEIARQAGAERFAQPELRAVEAKLAALEHDWHARGNQGRYE